MSKVLFFVILILSGCHSGSGSNAMEDISKEVIDEKRGISITFEPIPEKKPDSQKK